MQVNDNAIAMNNVCKNANAIINNVIVGINSIYRFNHYHIHKYKYLNTQRAGDTGPRRACPCLNRPESAQLHNTNKESKTSTPQQQ